MTPEQFAALSPEEQRELLMAVGMTQSAVMDDDSLAGAEAPIDMEPVAGETPYRNRGLPASQQTTEYPRYDQDGRQVGVRRAFPGQDPLTDVRLIPNAEVAAYNAADERMDRFEQNMADAYGHSSPSFRAEPYQPTAESAPAGMTPPGPRDPFTNQAAPPRPIRTARELAEYETRTPVSEASPEEVQRYRDLGPNGSPYRSGNVLPSQEDMDMWERGYVRVLNPMTGESSYRLADTSAEVAGAPGRRGRRYGLMQAPIDPATDQPLRTASGEPAQKYRITSNITGDNGTQFPVVTPTGTGVDIYEPTPEFRAMLAGREADQRLERLATRAGMSYDDAKKLLSEGGNLDDIRRRGSARLQEGKEARQAEVVRRAQERYNPTALLNDDWRQFVVASRLLGSRAGASPSDIALAGKQAEAAMETRLGVGQGFQQPSDLQNEMLQQKVDAEKPPQALAQRAVSEGRFNDPSVYRYADDIVHSTYSSRPGMLGVSSRFTDNEVALAAQRLRDDTGMPLEEATKIMRRIQEDRSNSAVASSVVGSFYDR